MRPAVISTPQQTAPTTPPADRGENKPFSPQDQQSLSDASKRVMHILKAVKMATFNGVTAVVFAATCFLFALSDHTNLVVGIGLAGVSFNEFRGRRLLKQLEPHGLIVLGWNQIILMALLIVYSLWGIYHGLTSPNPYQQYMDDPDLAKMLGPIAEMYKVITLVVYISVIVLGVLFQALNARYFFRRVKPLQEYLAQTPPWIIDLHRSLHG